MELEVPTNWDDLYDVLVAFKTQDPNGNGAADEIPMDWAPGLGGFNALNMLGGYGIPMSSFESSPGFYLQDGVVKNYLVDDRYKELIMFLNKCYDEGLINTEVFTQDYSQFQAVTRNPEAPVVGYTFGWDITDRVGMQWAPQYETIAPLTPTADYDGEVFWRRTTSWHSTMDQHARQLILSAKINPPQ